MKTVETFKVGHIDYEIVEQKNGKKRLIRYDVGEDAKATIEAEEITLEELGSFRVILTIVTESGTHLSMWLDSDGDVALDESFLTNDQIEKEFSVENMEEAQEMEREGQTRTKEYNVQEEQEQETTTDLAVPTEGGLENVMEVDLDEDFDQDLGRFLMEREYYHDGIKNEPPKLEAEIIDANMDLNRRQEIWVQFRTPTGRTIQEFFEKPALTDTFESNMFLKLLKVISVSGYEPDAMKGKKVPIQVDEEGEFFDVLIETDEERLDRLHEEAKMEHEPLSGESAEVLGPTRRERAASGAITVAKKVDNALAHYRGPIGVGYFAVFLGLLISSAMSVPFPGQVPFDVIAGAVMITVWGIAGAAYEQRYA